MTIINSNLGYPRLVNIVNGSTYWNTFGKDN